MIELSDDEAKTIIKAVEKVQQKHMDGSDVTGEKMGRLANELEGRLNDLGYAVTVDVSPLFAGQPPTVRIDARVQGEATLGVEKKMYEVRKRAEKNEPVPEIEGHV